MHGSAAHRFKKLRQGWDFLAVLEVSGMNGLCAWKWEQWLQNILVGRQLANGNLQSHQLRQVCYVQPKCVVSHQGAAAEA